MIEPQGIFKLPFDTSTVNTSLNEIPSPDAWHLLSLVYTGSTLDLYLDGLLKQSVPASGTIADSNRPLHIGTMTDGKAFFSGLIDEVALYKDDLSQEAIANAYCAGLALAGTKPLPVGCL